MSLIQRTVFISYRHNILPWAMAASQHLMRHGFDVFFDCEGIQNDDINQTIEENIKGRAHFLVLLAPSVLERYENPDDRARREIEIALEWHRSIIPVILEGFDFGSPETKKCLTGNLEKLSQYQAIGLKAHNFAECMEHLRSRLLIRPLDIVLQPISADVQQIVKQQRKEIENEPAVGIDVLIAQEWFEKGLVSKEPEEQITCYTNSIDLLPRRPGPYNKRGLSYSTLGQHQKAVEDFNRAIKLKPDNSDYYNNRGDAFYKIGQYQRAIEDYDRAVELKPQDGSAYFNKARVYAAQANIPAAINSLQLALTHNQACYCERMKQDGCFDAIRNSPEFIKLIVDYCIGQ